MGDREARLAATHTRLLPLEPLRRRVVRVYWMRGLLVAALLAAATALALLASLASMLWLVRTLGVGQGELVVRVVPLLLALVAPPVLIALGAGLLVVAIVRGYGRATVLEYETRFRGEVVVPLLQSAAPDVTLEPQLRVSDVALAASGLFAGEDSAEISGGLLLRGRSEGVGFSASMLRVSARRGRLGRRVRIFSGVFASVELEGRFAEMLLLPPAGARAREWPRPGASLQRLDAGEAVFAARFEALARDPQHAARTLDGPARALLAELAGRAGAPLIVSLHPGGVQLAIAAARLFRPARLRPSDAALLLRQAELLLLVSDAARGFSALAR